MRTMRFGEKPCDPRTGEWYMRNATTGQLSFFTSFNTEPEWDFVFVEAQSLNADGTYNPAGGGSCTPSGTTGEWHAASGNSGGWQEWEITVGGQPVAQTSFETDTGGWAIPGAHPAGPSSNLNDWIRSQRIFEDAAVTKSEFGLFFGFGFEGVDGAANRAELMWGERMSCRELPRACSLRSSSSPRPSPSHSPGATSG